MPQSYGTNRPPNPFGMPKPASTGGFQQDPFSNDGSAQRGKAVNVPGGSAVRNLPGGVINKIRRKANFPKVGLDPGKYPRGTF